MQDVHHIGIVFVICCFETDNLLVPFVPFRLVEYAQYFVQLVVDLAMQQWYLYDDAVVYQTVDEWVRVSMFHLLSVIINSLMTDVNHSFVNVADTMSQEIDRHHRNGISLVVAFLLYVFFGVVLQGKIAAET